MAARALIQGSSRGIGLEYCRMILSRSHDAKVIATCRSPDSAKELHNLSSEMSGRLCILPLDVTKENDIQVYFCTCCIKEQPTSLTRCFRAYKTQNHICLVHKETNTRNIKLFFNSI